MFCTYKHLAYTAMGHLKIVFILTLAVAMPAFTAKSNPSTPPTRLTAFKRAKSLDNGITISWFEQTWNKEVLAKNPLKTADFELLKQLGFKSLRLPIAFAHFEREGIPVEQIFSHIDNFVKQCRHYGFKIVLDYHGGNLNDTNYAAQTSKLIDLWTKLTKRYAHINHDELFFELYNEPPHMNPQTWKDAAYNIANAIHRIDKERTLIIGASNYNSIYELSRFVRLADENVIYTFHFYEPFLFTHQGAEWVGDQESTIHIPFPYNPKTFPPINPKAKNTDGEKNYNKYQLDGNEGSIHDKLSIVKNWADKYYVPVICGEYGVYNKYADLDSRCRYIKSARQTLKSLNMPGMLWDYNGNFSIFNGEPSMANLPDCMKEAIGYHGK